ncbi:glycosyltransferase family 4 protein [Flavobacterium sp. YJ01]|uniref:glycosyltransferase family 4 protein n=1 Tax=unclassified Flavobacterium TaxID=196869 RepID=UPI0023E4489F|nr:glycosyltransferase family 4 protein [Flavobacterium sp. YJ01]WET01213.1 glycosyltransferase family 4 protein [Flavobacterium sp. YJ01]
MKITILFLGKVGAGPRYTLEMAKALSEKPNIELQIILSSLIDNHDDWLKIEKKGNVKITYFNTYKNKVEFLFAFINLFKSYKISRCIKKFNPIVLYIPMISLLNPGVLLFLRKINIYYTLHDPIEHVGEANFFVELIRKFEIKKAKKIILLNVFFKRYVCDFYKKQEEDIMYVPHAAFFSNEEVTSNNCFLDKILFVGRIEEYKGIGLLLDAFSEAIKLRPNLKLTIAGRGELSPYLDKISKLSDNIEIINRWLKDEEVEQLIKNHDFVILPYIDASQSGVVPVVFANKRTVIATNKGALAEQIPNGLGFVVEPNHLDISKKICEIYDDGFSNLAFMNEKAYQYAIKNLTWQSSAETLISHFNNEYYR